MIPKVCNNRRKVLFDKNTERSASSIYWICFMIPKVCNNRRKVLFDKNTERSASSIYWVGVLKSILLV
jgi:REP element-mobilizing transposase RayT